MNQSQSSFASTPRLTQIVWLVSSLLMGFFIGNIVLGLPFAALLYFGVPNTKWNAGWTGWRKVPIPWRAVVAVAVLYTITFVVVVAFGPWLTAGMGR